MALRITQRKLIPMEIEKIVSQMKRFPHVGFIDKKGWNSFGRVFVTMKENKLVGVCATFQLQNWVKIGPLLILEEFQNKRYGRTIFNFVVNYYKKMDLYVGSSNPKVWKMTKDLKFKKVNSIAKLPREIKIYLIRYFLDRLSISFFIDAIRKKLVLRNRSYCYFLRKNT